MAIAFVQELGSTAFNTTTSAVLPLSANTTAGNRVILAIGRMSDASTSVSVADSKSNTWAVDANLGVGGIGRTFIASAYLTTALLSTDTITITFGTGVSARYAIEEYSGILTASPVDITGSTSGTTGTASSLSVTTVTDNALVFSALGTSAVDSPTVPTGFTARGAGGDGYLTVADHIQASHGAAATNWSWSTSDSYIEVSVAYKPAASAATVPLQVSASVSTASGGVVFTAATQVPLQVAASVSTAFLSMSSGSAGPTGYANVVLATAGLVSYWRLSDTTTTAIDSKSTNNGTYTGTYTQSQAGALYGDPNKAVLLDGVSGYVTCANPAAFQVTTGSLEVWFRTSVAPTGFQAIFVKGTAFGIFHSGTTSFFGYYDWGASTYHATSVTLNDSKWHHCVLTFQPNTASLYLDGVNKISGGAMTVTSNAVLLSVGSNGGSSQFLGGTFDEAAIYNTVLSSATILNHYQEGRTMRSNQMQHRASRPVTPSQGRF